MISGKVSSRTKYSSSQGQKTQSVLLMRRTARMMQMATPTNILTRRKHRERQSCKKNKIIITIQQKFEFSCVTVVQYCPIVNVLTLVSIGTHVCKSLL